MNYIDIPVRPHVLKFLHFYLGEQYVLSENDQFGAYLYSQLRRPLQDARRDHVLETYGAKWRVQLGALDAKKHGLRLTGKGAQKFNDWVDAVLDTEMMGFVSLHVQFGNKIKYAIEQYMHERLIGEEDIQYETLYKRYQRDAGVRQATKKLKRITRPGRADQNVRRDLARRPLPTPPAARPAA
ncbi:hypothetical protein [Hymenobacter rubidus]|uniref:hypothetical protein n=1 Tax=Hymenobacter rubidus TaxID=1441626 RepID=UPI00191E3542|nr:hypothetical protein [Hymenobacter rubidus]